MLRKNKKVLYGLTEALNFKPHPGQREILDAFTQHRFLCIVCGRRFGKSKIASVIADYTLLEKDAKILCVSKTYKLSKKVWNYVIRDVKLMFKGDVNINKSDMIATTKWGSSLELGSADNPDSLLGDGYDVVIVDEAATISEKIWQQNILPMIRDRKGSVVLITTPRGYNWVYDRFTDGEAGIDGWWSKRGSAFENTIVYDADEIDLVKKQTDKLYFEQEYLALFRTFADQVYGNFDRDKHLISKLPDDFDSWDKYVTIDPGYAQMCAMVWVGHNRITNESIIYREHLAKRMQHKDVLLKLKEHEPPGGYASIIADVAGKQRTGESGRSFKSYLQEQPWFIERGYSISTKRYRLISGINKVRAYLCNVNEEVRLRVLDTCTGCTQMFENYHYKEDGSSDEPVKDGVFDHPADAIRYYVEFIDKSLRVYDHIDL